MQTMAPGCRCESTRSTMAPTPGELQSRGSTSQRMTRVNPAAPAAAAVVPLWLP